MSKVHFTPVSFQRNRYFTQWLAEKVSLIRPLRRPKPVTCNGDSSRSVYCYKFKVNVISNQNLFIQSLEDLIVNYDKTVRNSENEIIQFSYGGDGLDPILMEGHNVPVDFSRILLHVKSSMPFRDEIPLSASRIVEITDNSLENDFKSGDDPGKLQFSYSIRYLLLSAIGNYFSI